MKITTLGHGSAHLQSVAAMYSIYPSVHPSTPSTFRLLFDFYPIHIHAVLRCLPALPACLPACQTHVVRGGGGGGERKKRKK